MSITLPLNDEWRIALRFNKKECVYDFDVAYLQDKLACIKIKTNKNSDLLRAIGMEIDVSPSHVYLALPSLLTTRFPHFPTIEESNFRGIIRASPKLSLARFMQSQAYMDALRCFHEANLEPPLGVLYKLRGPFSWRVYATKSGDYSIRSEQGCLEVCGTTKPYETRMKRESSNILASME
jgi:hypothetical protein